MNSVVELIVKSILESNEFKKSLESAVALKLNGLELDLIDAGLDKDKVLKIFGKSSEKRNTIEKVSGEQIYENSPKVSSRRFLKPNFAVENSKKEVTKICLLILV